MGWVRIPPVVDSTGRLRHQSANIKPISAQITIVIVIAVGDFPDCLVIVFISLGLRGGRFAHRQDITAHGRR